MDVENYRLKDALNQRSYLSTILHRLLPDFADYNDPRIWRFTGTISYKQYRRYVAMDMAGQKKEIVDEVTPLLAAIPTADNWNGEH